jgi:hypothetical protein
LVFDAAARLLDLGLVLDFGVFDQRFEEVAVPLQLLNLLFYVGFVLLLHLNGVCVFKARLKRIQQLDALKINSHKLARVKRKL